ncbi:hypothetical protein K493DRAFT_209753 [Basidiobolus meristosporus CBS 931.73]|uniref:Maltase n=1 Tax=Basidiobolus meristosporus CBS 931.73 TaxID=1314790 RepID=A0A1Y1YTS1_9FUNG|nr:hypothetical protein K493DRAFT_209753 [Basidiobolus meristosporus CBS 931.73]|eukprot:ORY01376.1 hypothetical protein K493DRAFT_209753 [Basidiobolus meristosporus CBS 931.73]
MVIGLTLDGPPCNRYGQDSENLEVQVTMERARIHVKILDPNENAFEVPEDLLAPDHSFNPKVSAESLLEFHYESEPFSFWIRRKDTGETIFDTTGIPLIYEKEYRELTSRLPHDANIYGIGEVVSNFRRNPEYTLQPMWARDAADPINQNIYGTHPFYIELRDGKAHGVSLLNSFGMDVLLENATVAYKTLGGVLDFSFFAGPNSYDVIDAYTATIGRPFQVPYWSLGFNQCRYGYHDIQIVEGVVNSYAEAKIPLETMWTDIDYMDQYRDFTTDPVRYPTDVMRTFIDKLHSEGKHYVLIIDPAIERDENYPAWTEGVEQNTFIKNPDGSIYIGQVWPGYTGFPDWFNPNTTKWWSKQISTFHSKVPVDGLWIDMNEPSSFCVGSCGTNRTGTPPYPWLDPDYDLNVPQTFPNPAYNISNFYGNLSVHTVSTEATHYNGLTEFQVHNLFGHMEAIATRKALLDIAPEKRTFVLGRSTFPSSGHHEAHWTGDNASKWEYLRYSIPGILSFQMFGVPLVGSDICGFNGNTTEELCLRWMQLGSFYPFSRNHNVKGAISQEAYRWPSVAEASRKALNTRYSLLPYIYTQFQYAHTSGLPVWRPLPFEFQDDPSFLSNEEEILLGPAILVSPVLTENADAVEAAFPKGVWYNFYNYEKVEGGKTHLLPAPLDGDIPLHIRGGHVVPIQKPELVIADMAHNPFKLLVALDEREEATGSMYFDDGESTDVRGYFSEVRYTADTRGIRYEGRFNYYTGANLESVVVMGLKRKPERVTIYGIEYGSWTYDAAKELLTITELELSMDTRFEIKF